MITISLCMIVKDEEQRLRRCLDSICDLVDEIIIVDTGSNDATKQIAAEYTDLIYDFTWVDDFSAARNYAFSKATKEYIYTADADEVLEGENRGRFLALKETLAKQVEIVQMKYGNQLEYATVYNYDEEYRPKLFRRVRSFVWEDPVHETVRLNPVVYDSDIVITHRPHESHAKRDLMTFRRNLEKGRSLSRRLNEMYARELYMAGDREDLKLASDYFEEIAADTDRDASEIAWACCVVTRAARYRKDMVTFFKYATKQIAGEGNSEICLELGLFYEEEKDLEEAAVWYYNAAYETEPVLDLRAGTVFALEGLIRCYEKMGFEDQVQIYTQELKKEMEKRIKCGKQM